MHLQVSPYAVFLVVTASISFTLAVISWRRRDVSGGLTFSLLEIFVTIYTFTAGLEAAATGLHSKILWSKIEYIGWAPLTTLLLIFIVKYTRQDSWLSKPVVVSLFIAPAVTILLAFTNEYHSLIWSDFTFVEGTNNLIYHHGLGFNLAIGYIYAIIAITIFFLLRAAVYRRNIYRSQIFFLFIALMFPVIGSVIYILDIPAIKGIDTSPLGFMFTGITLFWTITRLKLFSLIPIARDTIIESLSESVIVLDREEQIADMNPTALRFFNIPAKIPIGQKFQDTFKNYPQLIPFLSNNANVHTELKLNDTPPLYLDIQVTTIHDKQSRLQGQIIIFRDITERKEMEQSLRENADGLRRLTDNMLDVISESDGNSKIIYISPSVSTVLGYAPDALVGTDFTDLIHADYRPQIVQEIRRTYLAAKSGGPPTSKYEYPVRHADGNYVWAESISRFLFDEKNRFITAITVSRDITTRKLAEDITRQSQELLNLVIDGVPALIGYLDQEERYLFVNRTYADWYDKPKEYFIGKRVSDILSDEAYRKLAPHYKEVFRGKQVTVELDAKSKIGEPRVVNVTLVPHFDEQKNVKALFVLIQDITDLKQAEETLRRTVAELETFNRMMVGREIRMVDLKIEINQLLVAQGQPPKYHLSS